MADARQDEPAAGAGDAVVGLGGRLAGLSLPRQVAVLAVWPLLEQVLGFVVGLTDLLISGRMATGPERVAVLDAMGLGGYVAWFFNILQGAVATGVMALVARAAGGRDWRMARTALGQGLWLGVAAGVVTLLVLQAGIGLLVQWVGLSPAAAARAEVYLRILAWSGPLSGALFAVNAALRGAGDTRTPFVAMVVVNLVNMALSWSLVFAPAPWGGHGIAGIAAGTVCGWAAGLATSIFLLGRGTLAEHVLRWTAAGLRWQRGVMARILRVGAPQSLEVAGMWLIHAFGIRVIARLPVEGALGAHILAIRVESMSFLPGFAVGTAAAALAGQYLGAGSPALAVRAVRLCWKLAVALMGAMGVLFLLGPGQLIAWMAPGSGLHQGLATPLVLICAFAQPAFATCIVMKTSMRGAGATGIVMRWSFGSMLFYRVGFLWWASRQPWMSLSWVWIVFAVDLTTQALVFSWLHFRGGWLKAKV